MTTDTLTRAAKRSRWLWAIAASAAVAIWSGWVSLGQAAGFGMVQPLPGILPWHLDTAITLPIGIEAYGAFALGAWLSPAGVPGRARSWARNSAVGALCLGMAGQVASHLLAAAHMSHAPWPVTVLVSCVPVVTLGFAAALTHLLRTGPAVVSEPPEVPEPQPAPLPAETPARVPVRQRPRAKRDKAERLIAADPGVSSGRLAETLGVPRSTAARWKTAAMANGKAHA